MSEMVERLARVLQKGRGCLSGEVPCPFCLWGPDERTKDWEETGCVWLARAAIEAMREPSEAMIAAGGTDSKWRVGEITAYASETGDLHAAFASDVWSAMVDAALKDQGGTS